MSRHPFTTRRGPGKSERNIRSRLWSRDTVNELKHGNAENLATRLAEVNAEKKLTRQFPSVTRIEQARSPEPVI
jgi:Domain of unknown function (DUF4332)